MPRKEWQKKIVLCMEIIKGDPKMNARDELKKELEKLGIVIKPLDRFNIFLDQALLTLKKELLKKLYDKKKIDKSRKANERRFPIGYNQARDEDIRVIEEYFS